MNKWRLAGLLKFDSLSKFFDTLLDGYADLNSANEDAKKEEFIPDQSELEIQCKQEAQRMALAHGGFADLIDFEAAIKNGAGADYHDSHGYPGMVGEVAHRKQEQSKSVGKEEMSFEATKEVAQALVSTYIKDEL